LNSQIFMEAWDVILKEGRYLKQKWVVKIDPDAVFLPKRLGLTLKKLSPKGDEQLYLINCKLSFGFYGALEVFSSLAIQTYGKQKVICMNELPYKEIGEDLYMKQCLDLLGVQQRTDLTILADEYCGAKAGECHSQEVAAFHPYKNTYTYFNCLEQAHDGAVPADVVPADA